MRVTADEIVRAVDWTREQCSDAIANDDSVAMLGKPSMKVVAMQMASVALWLLSIIALSVCSEPEPESILPIETPKRGRPRKTAA
jgi:hypothetical protein